MKINKKIRMILLSTALVFGSMFLTACQDGKNTANSKPGKTYKWRSH